MKKKLVLMTSFGPIPYDIVEEYLPREEVESIECSNKGLESILREIIRDAIGEEYYIIGLAEKKGWEPYKMERYIENLTKFNPAAAAMVLLKEIAIDFDDRHEGNIEDSKEIWTISMLNGKVEQVDKNKIKNYRNFPAFRSKVEAEEAHAILSKRLRRMFRGCGE